MVAHLIHPVITEVEELIPDEVNLTLKSIADYEKDKLIEYVDLRRCIWMKFIKKFNLDKIYKAKFSTLLTMLCLAQGRM